MAEERRAGRHSITLDDREKLNITGVLDVISFDEETIIADTEMGVLIIRGSDMRVSHLNLDDSSLLVEGEIQSLEYSDDTPLKGKPSFLSKIFK